MSFLNWLEKHLGAAKRRHDCIAAVDAGIHPGCQADTQIHWKNGFSLFEKNLEF